MKVERTVDDDDERKAATDDIVFINGENPSEEFANHEVGEPEIGPVPCLSSLTNEQGIKKVGFLENKEDVDGNLLEILFSGEEIQKVQSLVSEDKKKEEMNHLSSTTAEISDLKEEEIFVNNDLNPPSRRRRRRKRCKKENARQIDNGEGQAACENTTKPICEQNGLQKEEESASSSINGVDVKKDDVLNISPVSQVHIRAPIKWSSKKKLLVLDLNGLLVDVGKRSSFKRPFCDDFLNFCFGKFNVGVWSSRTREKVNKVVDFVMGGLKQNLLFCWDLSHCTNTGFRTIENRHKPLVLKELKKLWNKYEHSLPWEKGIYNKSNTILLDDSPYKALLNPLHTAIFPLSYSREDKDDNSLGPGGDLRVYLEGLVMAENANKYVEQHPFGQSAITNMHPSWLFYQRVIYSNAPKINDQADLSSIRFMGMWEHFRIK